MFQRHPKSQNTQAAMATKLSAVRIVLFGLLLTAGLMLAAPAQGQQLSLATSVLDAPGNTALAGDDFRYRVSYSCNIASPPPTDCDGASVEVDLPIAVVFVSSFFPPGDVATGIHDGSPAGGAVTFTFNPNVPAGNTGDLDITVRFPNGSTPDGTMTTVTPAEVRSMGTMLVPQTTELPQVTASASPMVDVTVDLIDGFLDSCQTGIGNEPSTYQVTVGPDTASGSLDFDDVLTLVLTLPAGVDTVVPMDGGIEGPPGTITWSNLGPISVGSTVTVNVGVNFPTPTFSDGQMVTAMVNGTVDPIEAAPPVVNPTAFGPSPFMHTLSLFEHTTGTAVSKSFGDGRPASLPPGSSQTFVYDVSISNTGSVALDTLVVTDDGDGAGGFISTDLDISMVTTGIYSGLAGDPVTLTVNTDMGPFMVSGGGPTNGIVNVPGAATVETIVWTFTGGAPVGMSSTTQAEVTADVTGAAAAMIDNHVTSVWTATPPPNLCGGPDPASAGGETDNSVFSVNGDYTYLRPQKNETSTGPYFPMDTVSFSLDAENDALADDPATGVVVTDLLPEFLDFQTGTNVEDFTLAPGVSLATFEDIDNYNGTGRTLLRWTLLGDLDPGETVNITFDTEVVLGVIFGTLTNEMGMTFPAGPTQKECATGSQSGTVDVRDLDGDGDDTDFLCTATEDVQIAAVAQLRSEKFVRGQCDAGFLDATMLSGTTVPGGIVDWRVEVQNIQTVPMENFVIVDILPFVGDTGVVDPNMRDSDFRPLLIAPITPPPGGTVFYSTSGNPCRGEVGGPAGGCDSGTFSVIPPVPITATQSIKIEFTGRILNPLDLLEFEWTMILPADVPTLGEEAFNSFAFGSNRQDDGGFLSAEPLKVGIDATCMPTAPDDAMLGNFVWLDVNGDGDQDGGAEVGINDVPVQLFDPGPDGMPRTGDDVLVLSSITADDDMGNPGWYKFQVLSAGDYYVQFFPPPNFDVTVQGMGGAALDSDTDPVSACTDVVTLMVSDNNPDIDMGLLAPVTASLGNYVWFDRDGDGVQNEALNDGINGVAVKLFTDDGDGNPEPGGDDGTPLQVTVTADDTFGNPGFYAFEGLIPSVPYFVQVMLPANAAGFTTRNAGGDDTVDSDVRSSDMTSQIVTLTAGEDNPTLDAGIVLPTGTLSLGNVVWMDDGDDVFDPLSADMPLNGVRVNLYLDDSADGLPQVNEYFGSTVTATLAGKDGRYRFDDLPAGDFIVEIPASNFAAGEPLEGKISVPFSTVDPNDDVDHDDSGDGLATVVVSPPVTLSAGAEPTIDADDDLEPDVDVHFALDFGFVIGTVMDFDFGDAPDAGAGIAQGNYETTVFDAGAFHELVSPMGPYLGACVDSDTGMQQSFPADADDLGGALTATHGACASAGDDEDGVTFSATLLMIGGTFDVTIASSSVAPCLVNGFIDWNRDGDYLGAGEQILSDVGVGLTSVPVPATAVPGFTYARFRCSTAGGDGPTGFSADGEVEDYVLQVRGADLGDAPDTYGTLLPGGAVHNTDPGVELYLGSCVDTEPDGQPTVFPATASTDDVMLGTSRIGDCIDDEDGITFDTMLVRGQMATITATASVPDPPVGMLDAWIDFNGNGAFEHPGEHLFAGVSQSLATGSNALPAFLVPATATPGVTYARFRLSSAGGLTPTGMAASGEVEDYEVVVKGFDFGDLPDPTYPTLVASAGAQHVVDPNSSIYLGNCADPEDDGVPSVLANGDDLGADNGNMNTGTAGTCVADDDEDGVTFNTMVVACQTATITVDANATGGRLDAWIDFDPTTSPGFDAGDQIVTNMALASGNNVLNIAVPCSADVNVTSYARFRFSSAGSLGAAGLAMDGEVEDYTVFLKGSDFGDAPDSYDTTNGAGGPKHGVDPRAGNEFVLGACADTELDGPGAGTAVEDDGSAATSTGGTCGVGNDDEDGIAFAGAMAMAGACTNNVGLDVTLLNSAGVLTPRLDAWIDWNGDGDFDHPAEHLFGGTSAALVAGLNNLTYNVPCDAVPQLISYARFRLSSTGGLLPGGGSLDGEVEDYAFQVKGVDFGDAPDTYGTTLTATLGDASHTIIPGYSLGATEDTEANGQPSVGATGDGADEDGVVFAGGMAMAGACTTSNGVDVTLTNTAGIGTALLDAWIDFNGDGDFDHPAEHLFGGASSALTVGANALTYDVPCNAMPQTVSYARFRLSSTGGLTPADGPGIDPVANGEVEDYAFQVKGVDFGDAPDTYGTTQGSGLGDASHTIVPGYSLGAAEDTEADGQPNAGATGDGADEDGVVFAGGMTMAGACSTANGLTVTLTNTAGIGTALLDAWIDFNGDGDFDHPAEHLFGGTSAALAAGANPLAYDVPCDAVPQTVSYGRFRLSSTGSLMPTDGPATDPVANGEVEDYAFQVKGVDFGDAPDTYGTTRGASGPSHTIVPGYSLGAGEDTEPDGQPTVNADGDGADEDGVVLIGGQGNACTTGNAIDITLTNTAGIGTALLDGWIDFNNNDVFDHPAEHLFGGTSVALTAGVNNLTYDVPCDAEVQEVSYGRFRLSSTGGLLPTDTSGPVADGEVEDYAFRLKGVDFGDAPDTYGTTDAAGGPSHTIVPEYGLGATEDSESDGQPSPDADGDGDDEDGVAFDGGMAMAFACSTGNMVDVTLTNTAGLLSALLDGWIDFDGNGTFDHPAEHLFGGASLALVDGVNNLTYDVPCNALRQTVSYARFRLSTAGGLTPNDTPGNPVADGEVEDYVFEIKGIDLGDAPNSYSTTLGVGGAFHPVDPAPGSELHLGACVDTESDGQPSGSATDDDTGPGTSVVGTCAAGDDEDGVTFDTMVVACQNAALTVTANAAGLLDAFLDFDGDGAFDLPRDQIFAAEPLAAGANNLTFFAPCDASDMTTYARFRLSSAGGLSFDGGAVDGEVEDYLLVLDDSDFGDAPDSYGTLFASGGPLHGLDAAENLYLGICVDAEAEGQANVGTGDDNDDLGPPLSILGVCDPVDGDEDGVTFDTMIIACQQADITVTASAFTSTALLDAWVDLNGDGTFSGPADQIFASQPLVPGANSLSFTVPCDAIPGDSYARFRVSTVGGLPSGGPSFDGEIEDHPILVKGSDFGDAPDSYSTTIAVNGPFHGVDPTPGAELYLGVCVDTEPNGQPSVDADGDDLNTGAGTAGTCAGNDDEDGVTFDTDVNVCLDADITVTASAAGVLSAWIDFNGDGTFNGPADQIITDAALVAGPNPFTFSVPCDAIPGDSYTRFRFSTTPGLPFTGQAVDGEVEDHPVLIKGFDFGDAPDPVYPTLFASDGARHVVLTMNNPTLGALADIEIDGNQSPDHQGDDNDGVDDEDGVTLTGLYIPNAPASIGIDTGATGGILNAWIDYNQNGSWNDAGEQVAVDLAIAANVGTAINLTVDAGAVTGPTCARFRFSSSGGLLPTGQALDGEVEDYELDITLENAQMGLSKEIIDIHRNDPGGSYDVTFRMGVENLGNIRINDIQVIADLVIAFMDAGGFSVSSVTSTDFAVNPLFNGDSDPNLLDGTDSLDPGGTGEILLVVNILPGGFPGPYFCSATLEGTSDADTPVTDISQEGGDPDPDGDGDPREDDPTVLILPLPAVEIPTLDRVGLIAMVLLLAGLAAGRLRRRRLS